MGNSKYEEILYTGTALLIAIVCMSMFGCVAWGLGKLRAEDAQIRKRQAEETRELVEAIREVAENEEVPAIVDLAEQVDARLIDMHDRARISAVDHGATEKIDIDPESDTADAQFNEYAGMSHARSVKRRTLAPERVMRGMATVVKSIIPWWVQAIIWCAVIYAVVTTVLAARTWIIARLHRKELEEAHKAIDEYDLAIEKLPEDQRKEIGKGVHLQQQHAVRNAERKRDLERWVGQVFPGLEHEEMRANTLQLLGTDTRHRRGTSDGEAECADAEAHSAGSVENTDA